MFYYDFGDFHVVGASPEILVRKEGATVTLRPIAGTRPRGATRDADEALAQELLADPKEIAEHVMLVDLGRNDVGRVAADRHRCSVTERMVIERYSHVMHIVSNVEGTLKPGLTSIDVLRASFPAGTVSGAPKVRAMEIIDELEPDARGIYAGAVGYVSFQDDMDTAIAIRTAVVKDGMLYVQAGAGIVHDSVPESEWQETQNKARAVLRAAEMVQQGLRRGGLSHAADDRQLRQLHLQPRPVPRRARRRRARPSQRCDHARPRSRRGSPTQIVISPGPCTPNEAGISVPLIQRFAGKIPILGVCLGHQAIGQAFGGRVVRAQRVMHGKLSPVTHDGRGVFAGLPVAVRRRRATIRSRSSARRCRPCLEVTATADDGEIMGVRHRDARGRRRAVPSRGDPDRARPRAAARISSRSGDRRDRRTHES